MREANGKVKEMELDFAPINSSQDMMDTLNKVTGIFKEVAQGW